MGFFLLASLLVSAAADESPEQCAVALDELVGRVERSYAGYHIEVVRSSDRIAEYRRFLEGLRRRTVQESVADCHFVLRDYVNWFRDPHLFVIENPRFEPAELPSHQVPRSSLGLAGLDTAAGEPTRSDRRTLEVIDARNCHRPSQSTRPLRRREHDRKRGYTSRPNHRLVRAQG